MKGGHSSRSWGRQSSFTVAALFFTTILLWSWENNPLLTSLLSAQEQFLMHTTDFTVDPFADPSVSTNPSGEQEQGLSQFPEGTEDDDTIKPFEIDTSLMNMPHHEGRDQNKVSVSSLEKKVLTNPLGEQDQGSVSQLPEGTEDDDTVKPFEIDTSLMNMPRHEGRDQNKVSVSSLEKKDPLGEQEQGSVSQFHEGTEDDDTVKPFESDTSSMNMPHHEGRDKKKVSVSSLEKKGRDKNKVSVSSLKKACNYGKGRWVADSRRPLYSGFGCKQWLSDMWACRLTQRKDFSYENYRWQPNDCEMPEFQGSKFLRRMQDKTIAFIGDSLGRQQFQSLMCMASGGEEMPEVESVEWKYGLSKPKGAIRPDGWAYRFPSTNTTILYYWSASLCGIEPINITDPATEYAMHLDRPPAFLERYLPQFDVVILNTGHHWNRGKLRANRWVMYADGKPVTNRKLAEMGNAKNHTLHSIARWLDSQIPLHPGIKVFLRTISPRHFSNGEWNTGGSCDNISPLLKGSEVLQNQSSDHVAEAAARGTKVKLLDITALSELRDESHLSHYSKKASVGINDCLHWCLPGIPDTWNELFYAQL